MSDTPQGATAPEITLYSTAICPYCVAAKNFLKSKGHAEYTEVRVDLDPAVKDRFGLPVPRITHGQHRGRAGRRRQIVRAGLGEIAQFDVRVAEPTEAAVV